MYQIIGRDVGCDWQFITRLHRRGAADADLTLNTDGISDEMELNNLEFKNSVTVKYTIVIFNCVDREKQSGCHSTVR